MSKIKLFLLSLVVFCISLPSQAANTGALVVDGASSLQFDLQTVNASASFSWQIWVKSAGNNSGVGHMVNAGGNMIAISSTGETLIPMVISNGSKGVSSGDIGSHTPNGWDHYVMVYTHNSSYHVYKNGTDFLVNTNTTATTSTGELILGDGSSGAYGGGRRGGSGSNNTLKLSSSSVYLKDQLPSDIKQQKQG